MNCLFWNCQGLGGPLTIHTLEEILREHNPQLVFLSETRATPGFIDKLKQRWNLFGIAVDRVGSGSGLALLWSKEVTVELRSYSQNFIDVNVDCLLRHKKWRFTGFYGFPENHRKRLSWELLRSLGGKDTLPWIVGGDFNETLHISEKSGGRDRPPHFMEDFRGAIDECGLSDIGWEGKIFTWTNNRKHPYTIRSRLDRVCVNGEWAVLFPNAVVRHLEHVGSDHSPILLNPQGMASRTGCRRRRPFRYEAMWASRSDCEEIVQRVWDSTDRLDDITELLQRTTDCRMALMQWNKFAVKAPDKEIKIVKQRINELRGMRQSTAIRDECSELQGHLEKLIGDKDMYWRQRSKAQWIKDGDRNTKFFHARATSRLKQNRVDKIRDKYGNWHRSEAGIELVIQEYFDRIFSSSRPSDQDIDEILNDLEPRVDSEANQRLSAPFTASEILPSSLNFTFIVLIPKKPNPERITEYRPISLCNVIYKIGSKMIANRVKPLLDSIISPTQSAFVPNRLITDNILDAYEVNHFIRTCPNRSNEHMVVKLDISKAYDRNAVDRGEMHGVKVAPTAPVITNLCFADDTLIFCKATGGDAVRLKMILERYAGISGLEAGKEVLIKAVLQAIPSFIMSCFMLPWGLLSDLEAAIKRFWWGNGASKKIAWMTWEKMCQSKRDGGMGFRDLRCFNLAMLSKQLWRVLTIPSSLLTQILKARYFPSSDIFRATLGTRPSATWRSLLKARPGFEKGLRRKIGNGLDTSIWGDAWLREEGNLRIITKRPVSTAFPNRVADLMDPITKQWNVDLIRQTFWTIDHARILSIPIGCLGVSDRWVWNCTNNGRFSVRSCYFMLMNMESETGRRTRGCGVAGGSNSSYGWKLLWEFCIPPKVKVFWWRACAEIIPTGAALFKRKIKDTPSCFRCGAARETFVHAIHGCGDNRKVWSGDAVKLGPIDDLSSTWQWFNHLHILLGPDKIELALIITWKLWDIRNKQLHGEPTIQLSEVLNWCDNFLDVYRQQLQPSPPTDRVVQTDVWCPPPLGTYKINFDAAFPDSQDYYRIAAVARDHQGVCVKWRMKCIPGRPTVADGEAHAAMMAAEMVSMQAWTSVILEGDCKAVISAFLEGNFHTYSYGAYLEEMVKFLATASFFKVHFVKRLCNRLAHNLASLHFSTCIEGDNLPSTLANLAH
ncbi:PREDICTED: uncharacterized protein LOC105978134 [Erythranthe guttata]|uniref:uncharacterized protein LOC105978134 n=1 Tax=Erythranthe guttata TaxID=4155 RepID=UPI00064DF857|nr:PREDICTED: uncharacterized protein LOC105978134 [Erythranthe guttata]|eukprot:XP_012859003.1 PREDICTED: uncharacterized protein LOC105978134 [Erythranthe guttata]